MGRGARRARRRRRRAGASVRVDRTTRPRSRRGPRRRAGERAAPGAPGPARGRARRAPARRAHRAVAPGRARAPLGARGAAPLPARTGDRRRRPGGVPGDAADRARLAARAARPARRVPAPAGCQTRGRAGRARPGARRGAGFGTGGLTHHAMPATAELPEPRVLRLRRRHGRADALVGLPARLHAAGDRGREGHALERARRPARLRRRLPRPARARGRSRTPATATSAHCWNPGQAEALPRDHGEIGTVAAITRHGRPRARDRPRAASSSPASRAAR